MYINRLAEEKFKSLNNFFPVVLVCGPRQVGKTTMLKHLAENQNRTYVTLDNLSDRDLAQNDPVLFFKKYKPPIIIDEVQYAPQLFSQIKIMCDNNQIAGEFWLTGSQSYSVMKNITESLAGRVGILNMFSLSHKELLKSNDFYDICSIKENINYKLKIFNYDDMFSFIFKGGMPKLTETDDTELINTYFSSYVSSYLIRDVMELGGVSDIVKFNRFLVACASNIGNLVNFATLAETANISQPTAKEWLNLLEGLGIVYTLQPYYNNLLKRMVKSPKLYFYDTGLCAYLLGWSSANVLEKSQMAGAFFENYCINELIKSYSIYSTKSHFYFYRDQNKNEIDLVIEQDGELHPFEIKLTGLPKRKITETFDVLINTKQTIAQGGIICNASELSPADERHYIIPVQML